MQIGNNTEYRDRFVERCRKSGLKITPQRWAVYRKLVKSKNHPTTDQVFQSLQEEFPNISYDTVNRTLMTFVEIGLVEVVKTKAGHRRFDHTLDTHHHFHCVNCGKVMDFNCSDYDNLMIPDQIKKNFTVFTKRVVLNGLCKNCRRNKNANNKQKEKQK